MNVNDFTDWIWLATIFAAIGILLGMILDEDRSVRIGVLSFGLLSLAFIWSMLVTVRIG